MLSATVGLPPSPPGANAQALTDPTPYPSVVPNEASDRTTFSDTFLSRIQRVSQTALDARSALLSAAATPHLPVKRYLAESFMQAAHQVKCLDSKKITAIAQTANNQVMVRMALESCASHCNAAMEALDAILSQRRGITDTPPLSARLEAAAASLTLLSSVVMHIDKTTPASETPFRYAIGATVGLVGFFSMYYFWCAQQNFSALNSDSDTGVSSADAYNNGAKNLAAGTGYGIVTICAGLLLRYDRRHAFGGDQQLKKLLNDLDTAKIAVNLIRQNLQNAEFLDTFCATYLTTTSPPPSPPSSPGSMT